MATIRAEAAARRVSIKTLALESGISYPAMRRYLNGDRPMDLSQFYRVADALGIDVLDLLADAARTDVIAEGRVERDRVSHDADIDSLDERPDREAGADMDGPAL